MPGSKIYVVTSLDLVTSIQRQYRVLAFPPLEAKFAMAACASSDRANEIVKINVNGEEGDWGYSMDFHKSMGSSLAPGAGLDGMNRVMIQDVAASLQKLDRGSGQGTRIGLVEWIRHEITIATTNAVYGPMNPFNDPKAEEAFWHFANDLLILMMNALPSVIARRGYHRRAVLAKMFEAYFRQGGHESGSILVQTRCQTSKKNGIPLADIARFEVGGAVAILLNTTPALFCLLFYTFANPQVLEDLRREIATIMTLKTGEHGVVMRNLDISSVKSSCPLLLSTCQELLRLKAMGTSVRQVMKDTMLNDEYLLKEGNIVLMPTLLVHTDISIWGPDDKEFNHKRFMKDRSGSQVGEARKQPFPAAFRVFGGGTTLCPGRHFAMTEILAVAVMFIMRFDMVPVSGSWTPPATEKGNMAAVIMEPDTEFEVDITPRKGYESGQWAFSLADSEMVFAVAVEDKKD